MKALFKILFNVPNNIYHPIFYTESPFPGGCDAEANQSLVRYKSYGHDTNGFPNAELAIESVNKTLELLKDSIYVTEIDFKEWINWDGIGIPADVVVRNR